jgi:hypothetical protein
MNFKPTILKILISVISGLLAALVVFKTYVPVTDAGFYQSDWIMGFIVLVLVYIIWSLVQTRKK